MPSRTSSKLPFCPPKTCLYYAGDFDSDASSANGLLNIRSTGGDVHAQAWVGVKPTKDAIVTGVTFNELIENPGVGTNPTPFQTRIGITEGNAGKIVCNTSGTATEGIYGESDFGLIEYNYTVKKLKRACKIPAPTQQVPSTYVNLLPTFSSNLGFLVNAEDANPRNHKGWANDQNDCYLYIEREYNYVTCNSTGIGSNGFSVLSIALTGTEGK